MQTWRRNQYVMATTVFVVFAGFAFVLPFLPLYVRELGVVSDDRVALWSGVLIGIGPLIAGLLAPAWGRLADRHGQKTMALVALGAYVVLLALSAGVRSVYELLAARVALGFFGGIGPLSLAMATAQGPRDETGRAVGLIEAAKILSAAIGPLAGGALASAVGSRITFLAAALVCLVALGLVAFVYEEAPRGSEARAARPGLSLRGLLAMPEMGLLLVVLFFVNFIGRSYTPILPLHLRALGVPLAGLALYTGLLISTYSIAAAVSATTLGRVCRDAPPRGLLVASLLGGAVTVLPMALVPSFGLLMLFAVLLGLASGGALTLCYTIGGLRAPGECRSAAFGYFSSAALFGGAVSPSVAGLLVHWDLRAIYYVNAALFLALAGALAARRASA
jgi:DHA1 family multidrug resistance protein-like MFS transporter